MRKGDSIGAFLKAVREQCAPQFRELRAVSVDNMMYVKVGGQGGTAAVTLVYELALRQQAANTCGSQHGDVPSGTVVSTCVI